LCFPWPVELRAENILTALFDSSYSGPRSPLLTNSPLHLSPVSNGPSFALVVLAADVLYAHVQRRATSQHNPPSSHESGGRLLASTNCRQHEVIIIFFLVIVFRLLLPLLKCVLEFC
jgi:hypothetical protein